MTPWRGSGRSPLVAGARTAGWSTTPRKTVRRDAGIRKHHVVGRATGRIHRKDSHRSRRLPVPACASHALRWVSGARRSSCLEYGSVTRALREPAPPARFQPLSGRMLVRSRAELPPGRRGIRRRDPEQIPSRMPPMLRCRMSQTPGAVKDMHARKRQQIHRRLNLVPNMISAALRPDSSMPPKVGPILGKAKAVLTAMPVDHQARPYLAGVLDDQVLGTASTHIAPCLGQTPAHLFLQLREHHGVVTSSHLLRRSPRWRWGPRRLSAWAAPVPGSS